MITSPQNTKLRHVRKLLASRRYRDDHQQTVLQSIKYIQELVKTSPSRIIDIFYTPEHASQWKEPASIEVDANCLEKIATVPSFQGVLAVVSTAQQDLDHTLKKLNRIVVLDRISDPKNVGAILRSAVAFNIDAVFFTQGSADPYHPEAIRATAGNLFSCHLYPLDGATFKHLLDQGFVCFGFDINASTSIETMTHVSKAIFLFGSEGSGIKTQYLLNSDKIMWHYIPTNAVESLNVTVSASIAFYVFNRKSMRENE